MTFYFILLDLFTLDNSFYLSLTILIKIGKLTRLPFKFYFISIGVNTQYIFVSIFAQEKYLISKFQTLLMVDVSYIE